MDLGGLVNEKVAPNNCYYFSLFGTFAGAGSGVQDSW